MQSSGKLKSGLWGFILFTLFVISLVGHRVFIENDIASRQQATTGITSQCEERGRGHENWCHYSFTVAGNAYSGVSVTYPEVVAFQTVDVYYDRQNPETSALVDFSEQRHKDIDFVYFSALALVLCVGFFLWNKAPYKEHPHELAP